MPGDTLVYEEPEGGRDVRTLGTTHTGIVSCPRTREGVEQMADGLYKCWSVPEWSKAGRNEQRLSVVEFVLDSKSLGPSLIRVAGSLVPETLAVMADRF